MAILETIHYKFNETSGTDVIDSSGNSYSAVNHGMSIVNGLFGKGLEGGRTSENYIARAWNSGLSKGDNFTFSFWYYNNGNPPHRNDITRTKDSLLTKSYTSFVDPHYEINLFISGTRTSDDEGDYGKNKLYIYMSRNGILYDLGTDYADSWIPEDQWNHIILDYNSGNVIVKVNNVNVINESVGGSGSLSSYNTPYEIGSLTYNRTTTQRINGIIDDFRFYKFNLTTKDISLLYNSGNGTETDLLTLRNRADFFSLSLGAEI